MPNVITTPSQHHLADSELETSIDSTSSETPTLLDTLIVLARNKKFILGFTGLALFGASILAFVLPKTYTAETRILPPQQNQSSALMLMSQLSNSLSSLAGSSLGLKNPSELYLDFLKSRTVIDFIIDKFDLMRVYNQRTLKATRKKLESKTTMSVLKSGVITVEVEDRSPQRAAALANGYCDALYTLTQRLQTTEASQRLTFYETQLRAAKDNLANAEVELKKTEESTGLMSPSDQSRAIIEAVGRLRAQIAAKEVELSALKSFGTEQNPEIIATERQLATLRAQLRELEQQENRRPGDVVIPTGKVPEVGLEYVRKLRDVKYYETLFELLAKQVEAARLDEAKDIYLFQVLDKAVVPEKKSGPPRLLIILVVTVLALISSCMWVLWSQAKARWQDDPNFAAKLHELRTAIF